VASIGFFNRPLDYLNTFSGKVQAVTRDDVMRAFKARVDMSKLQTILVGGEAK
jgi:zinc protease